MTAAPACRTCGPEPLENARFCRGCGSPLSEPATHAEYKQVTVLFADVVHSMDIAATVGPERLREIMADLANRCAAVVQRFDGTVDKFTGDAEKVLLERCSVFAGGFDLESACAVMGSDDDFATLDLLDIMVRNSLLVADRSSGGPGFYV